MWPVVRSEGVTVKDSGGIVETDISDKGSKSVKSRESDSMKSESFSGSEVKGNGNKIVKLSDNKNVE